MPFVPGANNFVEYLRTHDCARPWFVYVKTFVPAFIKMWVTITLLDPNDIARSLGYHITSGGTGPGGRGAKRWNRGPYANISNNINTISQRGLRTLLWITEPLEKIGFVWLLYSATDQFFYDWQTGLMRSIYCQDTGLAGPFQRSREGGANIGITPTGTATPLATVEQNRANWTNTSISVTLPPGFYTCVWALDIRGPANSISGVTAQLRVNGNLGPSIIRGEEATLGPRQDAGVTVDADIILPIGGAVVWELSGPAVPAGLFCTRATFICWATG